MTNLLTYSRVSQLPARTRTFITLLFFALFLTIFSFSHPSIAWASEPVTAESIVGSTYYVNANSGRDSNPGLSESSAFETLNKAVSMTNPGDTVLVMNGTYLGEGDSTATLRINRSGAPNGWITYKAYPGHSPLIQSNGAWQAVRVNAQYIIVDGFRIRGIRDQVSFAEAEEAFNNYRYNGTGMVRRVHGSGISVSSFAIIRNNEVFNFGGGGIDIEDGDSLIIENNLVYDTSHYSPFGHSNIAVIYPRNIDGTQIGLDGSKYKIIVRNNISHSSYNLFPCGCYDYRAATDGNGIIIDEGVDYDGYTLVANNLVFNNGGSGIHTYKTRNVDIINNTAYQNAQHPDIQGDLFARRSDNINIINNVIYARRGENVTTDNGGTNITYAYNIYYDGTNSPSMPTDLGEGDLIADPKFINPSMNLSNANFRLQDDSPGINNGSSDYLPMTDIRGVNRPAGSTDRGAYENESSSAVVGDVNCDDEVDSRDALFIVQYEVRIRSVSSGCPLGDPLLELNLEKSDVNCDGITDSTDALLILQYDVGLRDSLTGCAFSGAASLDNIPLDNATLDGTQIERTYNSRLYLPILR